MAGVGQAGGPRGVGIGPLVAWFTCAAFVGLAADLMQPAGPFVVFLAIVFVIVAIVCALLSFIPPIRSLMRAAAVFALSSVLIFGAFFVLQRYVAPQPRGLERGALAAFLPAAEDLQRYLLAEAARREDRGVEAAAPLPAPEPLSPSALAMKTLDQGLASPDPAERVRAAREALGGKDPAITAAAVERLYRTGEPALRQMAVAQLIAARRGARLPLIVSAGSPESLAFANALQAGALQLKSVDPATGVLSGGLCGAAGMSGTVARAGVTLTGPCPVGEAQRTVTMLLQPTEDFRLVGDARTDAGETARVELALS